MRNKLVLSFLIAVVSSVFAWSQFYAEYSDKDRKYLAESYYLVGRQYQKVGKAELGKDYEGLAYRIYPQLQPSGIVDEKLPSAEELLAKGLAQAITPPETARAESLPRSFFLRLLGAFIDSDATAVASFLDGSVYIDTLKKDITRAEAQSAMAQFFPTVYLSGIEPSAVYDLDSVVITRAPAAEQAQWGLTYILRVNAKMDFSDKVDIWQKSQQFFVHKVGDSWFIFGIGQDPPPLSWKPQNIPPAAARPAASEEATPEKEIVGAFTGCLDAFLKKDVEGTLSYIADRVKVVRMRETVSREELATTFQGYFEGKDFGTTSLSDVVDPESFFVEQTTDLGNEFPGPVFILNVKAKLDLSDTIPFWTTYQQYYFVKEGGTWKIVAVF